MAQDIRQIDSFGDIAAEDDSVLDYFLTTEAVRQIQSGKIILVLGRKGSGKTALVRHFTETDSKDHGRPLSLRNYPWGAHQDLVDKGASATEAYVASWRLLIAIRLASMVALKGSTVHTDSLNALKKFLMDNFNTLDPEARSILTQGKLKVSGLTFGPQVAGFSLGTISFGGRDRDKVFGVELNSLAESIIKDVTTAIAELRIDRLFLHFDELDQGLDKVDEVRARMLVGLILAARGISKSTSFRANVSPIVYLRTDIWEQLNFSDKNKTTQSSSIDLQWNDESLMNLVRLRLTAKLGKDVSWKDIEDGTKMRGSQSKWSHLLSRTLLRPRDVIQFLNEALKQAKQRTDDIIIFCNDDINQARDPYSVYLKKELDDEIIPHWKEWAEALQACSKTQTITFQRDDFLDSYKSIRSPKNPIDGDRALELLYRFSVVGYERRSGKGGAYWSFRYTDDNVGWDTYARRFKVHLGLKEYAKLKEERT